jgi:peptide-methionine (S)-S-oxide reductase
MRLRLRLRNKSPAARSKKHHANEETTMFMNRLFIVLLVSAIFAPNPVSAADPATAKSGGTLAKATFAGGCFWCIEADFDKVPGVVSTTSGYIGGHKKNPTYKEVSAGGTGHAEAVEIAYDPARISYTKLLDVFWHNIDPTVRDRQFCDIGDQYRTAIFYHDAEQKRLAEQSKAALEKSRPFPQAIVTEIVPAGAFTPAEEYHQNYYLKNPVRYKFYRYTCGRDQRLEELWGKSAGK